MTLTRVLLGVLLASVSTPFVAADDLKIVSWNVESGGAKPAFVGGQIAEFVGVDIWGLSEVQAGDAAGYAAKCGVGEAGTFKHIVGTTGNSDRLVIVYNEAKVSLVEGKELLDLSAQTGRAPLLAKFKTVASGHEFIFMVNHLHRTNPTKRMAQAVGLEAWAKTQALPAVLVGDYNFDVNVTTKLGNPEFVAMTDENVFKWVEPTPFRATHKGGSILDFVFLSGSAKNWAAKTEVVTLSDDVVNTLDGSDHRPLMAHFKTVAPAPPPGPGPLAAVQPGSAETAMATARSTKRNEILAKIARMEKDLVELKRLVKELGEE
jgi:endonuclease/exonuclease/phosphatase family metal-dependent hydrolase